MKLASLATLLILLLSACGGGGGSSSSGENPDPPDPNPTPTFMREANTSCLAPDLVSVGGSYSFTPAFPSLSAMSQPISLKQVPNDDSTWVAALREGQLVSFANVSTATTVSTVLDIRSQVTTAGEFGLTGFAFHPNYPSDNRVFVLYNDSNQSGRSTLSVFDVNTTNLTASNEQVLLTLNQPATNHNGGDMHFGADGNLYIAFGDGGANANTAQDLTVLHGSMIRIDVSGSDYSVPADNPFNTGQGRCTTGSSTSNCPEIYAYGFRNPWRLGFDSVTGDFWLGDVGESTFEEVDRIISGGNYGWPIMEANSCFNSSSCDMTGLQLPITQYGRSTGVSVVGGYVYRGTSLPDLVGQYIFGDVFSGSVFNIPSNSTPGSSFANLTSSGVTLGSLAQDNNGEIYALNLGASGVGDAIYRLTGTGSSVTMPMNLSDTGCFNVNSKTAPQGVIAYQVNSALWSDSAEKNRFFALPDNTNITVNTEGDFIFPDGTILIKHFLAGTSYLETRLMILFADGWRGYSYEWNTGQTEATLLTDGKTVDAGTFTHTIPSRSQCFQCHTSAANFSLGLESIQQSYEDSDLNANFMEFMNQLYLSSTVDYSQLDALVSLDDSSASLAARARSYLHSNCSGCHRPGSSASLIDLRYSTALADTDACDVNATLGDFGFPGAKRIDPGNAAQSTLLLRMQTLNDSLRMPPLASNVVDDTAVSVVSDWINGLQNCN
jgi:uncharacterized repeat protein (TIGR03806 family)